MKRLLVLVLCLSLLGLPACAGQSRYGPSLFELASERAVMTKTPDGTVTQPKLVISDRDVMTRTSTVEGIWEKRDQRARGLGIGTPLAQIGLGFLPSIISLFVDVTPLGAIISGASALLGKFIEVINPDQRIEAYADGRKMLMDARNEYLEKQKEDIPQDRLTDAGRVLARRTDCAIGVVDNTISGKVSNTADVSCATGK